VAGKVLFFVDVLNWRHAWPQGRVGSGWMVHQTAKYPVWCMNCRSRSSIASCHHFTRSAETGAERDGIAAGREEQSRIRPRSDLFSAALAAHRLGVRAPSPCFSRESHVHANLKSTPLRSKCAPRACASKASTSSRPQHAQPDWPRN